MLSCAEIARFQEEGFLIRRSVDSSWVTSRNTEIDRVLTTDGPTSDRKLHRHIDCRVIHELAASSVVTDCIADILGDDLLLWHTRLFDKPPSAPWVPWHQDAAYWPIEPKVCVSAWIAIDPTDQENGCMKMIPGSHHQPRNHEPTSLGGRFGKEIILTSTELKRAVDIELMPGDFVIFDRWIVHSSPENRSERRRVGLAARYIPTSVQVDFERVAHSFPGLGAQLVKGEDRHQCNRIAAPPAAIAR